jgi:MFS family permease
VQGVGAAALFPAGLALLSAEFTGPARARAIGVWGATVAGAIALGPLLGGLLVQVWGWRALFAAVTALVVPALLVGLRHLRESRAATVHAIDWLGTALLSTALFLAVLLLVRGNAWGWASPLVLGGTALVVALLVGFGVVEHRVAHPLIAPRLLRNPVFLGATLVALAFAAAGFAPITYLTQYLLTAVGSGPVLAGPADRAVRGGDLRRLARRGAGRRPARAPARPWPRACCSARPVSPCWSCSARRATRCGCCRGCVLFGAGAGLVNPTMTVAALAAVPPDQSGMASG